MYGGIDLREPKVKKYGDMDAYDKKDDGFLDQMRQEFITGRIRAGLSQRGAARMLQITPSILSGFESGQRIPRRETLDAIIKSVKQWQSDSQVRRVAESSPAYGPDTDMAMIIENLSAVLDCLLAADVPRASKLAVAEANLRPLLDKIHELRRS
jgi:DNA-binding XRE family transcriptional regulator